jgi:hypothetical protein
VNGDLLVTTNAESSHSVASLGVARLLSSELLKDASCAR